MHGSDHVKPESLFHYGRESQGPAGRQPSLRTKPVETLADVATVAGNTGLRQLPEYLQLSRGVFPATAIGEPGSQRVKSLMQFGPES